jgi:cell division protein ZapB
LTKQEFSTTLVKVDIDISSLEAKVERVAAFCEELREENHALREHITKLEHEKQALATRMTTARERLETVVDRLPVE